jgi:hypothetical protein
MGIEKVYGKASALRGFKVFVNLWAGEANMVETGTTRECFVNGGPHENRSVILAALSTSHDFDV